jgi:hypothetical protein
MMQIEQTRKQLASIPRPQLKSNPNGSLPIISSTQNESSGTHVFDFFRVHIPEIDNINEWNGLVGWLVVVCKIL